MQYLNFKKKLSVGPRSNSVKILQVDSANEGALGDEMFRSIARMMRDVKVRRSINMAGNTRTVEKKQESDHS